MSKVLLPLFLFCACWSAQAQLSLSMHTRMGGALDFASSNEIGLNVDLGKKNYASARIAMTRYTAWFSGDVNRPQMSPILGLGKVFSLTQRIALGGELDLRFDGTVWAKVLCGMRYQFFSKKQLGLFDLIRHGIHIRSRPKVRLDHFSSQQIGTFSG